MYRRHIHVNVKMCACTILKTISCKISVILTKMYYCRNQSNSQITSLPGNYKNSKGLHERAFLISLKWLGIKMPRRAFSELVFSTKLLSLIFAQSHTDFLVASVL